MKLLHYLWTAAWLTVVVLIFASVMAGLAVVCCIGAAVFGIAYAFGYRPYVRRDYR